ncbi:XisH protein [Coleofasciculus chthonoplastes PCC 7420]|uniref:XisH protein n=1 Tax=Coleofasciculus chthonoplastes PCC 7420 TaxID=118168 RepID=B4VJ15_9CYAN|nr:element excision factor XisH family protein [Coleofasciculus chthonoplastes]EDX78125.1 XisH protein [Coleofasciculus chthonoplastes PCC 7420]
MAKDIYHDTVRTALEKDGWTITDDPLTLTVGKREVFVDLAAEKPLTAERQGEKIAVEVKSFISPSPVKDLQNAIGQYILYAELLALSQPERRLYLAIREEIYVDFFAEPIVQIVLANHPIKLIIFNSIDEVLVKWIH